MKQKGLSQILYLIIAASVLMMIAMIITFTASDSIGSLGSQAEEGGCSDALNAKCTATGSQRVSVPTTCVTEGQYVAGFLRGAVQDSATGGGSAVPPADLASGTTGYVACSSVP